MAFLNKYSIYMDSMEGKKNFFVQIILALDKL